MGYRDYVYLGPRLMAVAWFQYRDRVAYSPVRSRVGQGPAPSGKRVDLHVAADAPFTVRKKFKKHTRG